MFIFSPQEFKDNADDNSEDDEGETQADEQSEVSCSNCRGGLCRWLSAVQHDRVKSD